MFSRLVKRPTFGVLGLVFLTGLIWLFSIPALAQVQPQVDLTGKNVLILHSHEANAPFFLETDKGLSKTLKSGGIPSLNQFFESLDLRRNPGPEHRKALVEKMRVQYGHRKVDVIITMYPEALEFVLRDCRDILPDVPILALYLPQSLALPTTGRTIIGHSSQFDIIGTLEIALKLVPAAKRVYVVSGVHEVDRRIEDQARRISKKWEGQVEFLYLSHMPFEDILAVVSNVPPGSIILLLVLSQDVKETRYTYPVVAQWMSQVSAAPIFGILDTALGLGIVGGSLINFDRIGSKAGELVLDVLRGIPPPRSISGILDVPPVPMFDWRQLRRWNLSVDAVPKGSVIINREYSFWDYKYYIIGGIAILLAQTALVIGLLVQRRRKNLAEESLRQKTEELDQRLRFEGLISNLSASFVNLPSSEIDNHIKKGLRSITEFFDVDRCSVGLFSEDGTQLVRAFEYHLAEAEPAPESLSMEQLPWFMDQLIRGNPLVMNRVEDLPPEAARERQFCLVKGMKSLLFLPMLSGNKTLGSCTLVATRAERVWPEELLQRFRLVTELFVNALERKRAEGEVTRARAELVRVQRLSHLTELTASLAHELNQPLAAILSNAQAALLFLDSDRPDSNEFREIISEIISDDQRAADVIRSLRSMMKRDDGEKRSIILTHVLNDVIQIFRSEAIFRNVSIETELDGLLPPVLGDKVQLQQVALNIIMNAAEAMAQNPPEHRRIIVRTKVTDQNIRVSIRDFGPGINQTDLGRVFHPFFTTKGNGMGMGLAVSSSIIKGHEGNIWAENNPDGGATFFIDLPIYESGK